MFSGIIQATSSLLKIDVVNSLIKITLKCPSNWSELKLGDSVAVNGICLTVEQFDDQQMTFSIGHETLKVTGWTKEYLKNQLFNLEGSLKFGDQIHGHMVTGHVDAMGQVLSVKDIDECKVLVVQYPQKLNPFLWPKGSICINGVSLTINSMDNEKLEIEVCIIPETIKRTNLGDLGSGSEVTLEVDNFARGLINYIENCQQPIGQMLAQAKLISKLDKKDQLA